MAIDFYKLGRQTGATTKPGRKSGAEALIGSVTDSIGGLLEASKEKTEELTASMPQGVAIEKVPENLRPQVTNFLTKNKAAYKDATKVLASGINPSSERYTEAVEVINSVNSRFENLSNNLEKIALERQKYLNNPSYSSNTSRAKQTTMYDLANGSLYGKMTLNEDASWNYTDSNGESKAFNDFKVQQPGFLGQNAHVGMLERVDSKNSYDVNGDVKPWKDNLEIDYKSKIEQLFIQLKPAGSLDYVLADTEFLEARLKEEYGTGDVEGYKDMLIEKPGDIINDYKEYSLEQVRKRHENLVNQNKSSKIAGGGGFKAATLNFQISGTTTSGQAIGNYIDRINNNKIISFTDRTNVFREYTPIDGGYQLKGGTGKTISKDRLGGVIMGLPYSFSDEVDSNNSDKQNKLIVNEKKLTAEELEIKKRNKIIDDYQKQYLD